VNVTGQCFANGGGAGEGANAAADGDPGHESTAPSAVGGGGTLGTTVGGNGGNGGVGTTEAKSGDSGTSSGLGALGGGGGGGGGLGIIKLFATDHAGTDDLTKVSPPPS
jgi:hypothetical protein